MTDPSDWVNSHDEYDSEKHRNERASQGFSEYDWWNFCDYIAWVNIAALEKFKTGVGHPGDLNSMDEWIAELQIMIDGFKAHLELNDAELDKMHELNNVRAKGLELYAKRFPSLWD